MIKKHFLLSICLLFLMIPLTSKNEYNNFIEGSNVNINCDGISIVIALNEELSNNEFVTFTDSLEQNQELIMKIRNQNKNYHKEKNKEFSKKYINTNGKIDISEFSPFIFVTFDDYKSYLYEKKFFKNLSKNRFVDKIYVEKTPVFKMSSLDSEISVNTDASSTIVDMETAKKLININNLSSYTGAGINIGIIDTDYPDNTKNFTKNQIVAHKTLDTSSHTNKVASIIGGTYGIAKDANLFIHSYFQYFSLYGFDDAIEWLLENGVNVINISMSCDDSSDNLGKYDGHSAYFDYIVWNNYVTIVDSAGNFGHLNTFIINPGIGANTLSVGSIDADKNISFFSSWNLDSNIDEFLLKPSLVAPGENIFIPNTDNSSYNAMSGTSFAAPMVTGTIALLMEEFPILMKYPGAYMSALISGASKLPSQTSAWNTYAGAGLINYEETRRILKSMCYSNATTNSSTNLSDAIISKDVSVGAFNTIKYCLFSVQNSNVTFSSSSIYTPNISRYQVNIYDENNDLVETTQYGKNSNTIIGAITNSSSTLKKYNIKVYLVEKKSSDIEFLSLSYSHTHSFSMQYYNYKWHKLTCECGYTTGSNQGHIVLRSEIVNGRYAECLECHHMLDLTVDMALINSAYATQVSINGSYILPSGIIVLIDDDLSAYLNGTLVFYDKDKVPSYQ